MGIFQFLHPQLLDENFSQLLIMNKKCIAHKNVQKKIKIYREKSFLTFSFIQLIKTFSCQSLVNMLLYIIGNNYWVLDIFPGKSGH